jgi:hypothetical protein
MPGLSQIVGIDPAAVTRWFDQLEVGFTGPLRSSSQRRDPMASNCAPFRAQGLA